MYVLTDCIKQLRERALNWETFRREYIGQRLFFALESLSKTVLGHPWSRKKSDMLSNIIEKTEPIIHEGELIVGYNYFEGGIWDEVYFYKQSDEEKIRLSEYLSKGKLSNTQIDFILNTLDDLDKYIPNTEFYIGQSCEYIKATDEKVICSYGTPDNHTIIGYAKVLQKGFKGIAEEIKSRIDSLDISDPHAVKARLLLECAYDVADKASKLGKRYKARAEEMLKTSTKSKYSEDLEKIIHVLNRVPEYPAESFHEAIQSLWFAHIINTWEDGINANSLGRLDQILYPYYKKDIDEGKITRDEAFELLCNLWIKLYLDYDVQQVALGGVDITGKDATNELTYMMLDVTEALDFIRCLSVRLNSGSPMKLIERSLQIVSKGKGIPFFFNDEVIIPALVDAGIALEDARDYAAIGCIEITIPGKANPHAVSNRVNLLKCLELALNNGASILTGKQLGPKTGNISEMNSMEDVVNAYQKQVEYFITLACYESNRCELRDSLYNPHIYKSILTEGCLENGRDFSDGGPKYSYHESMAMGIPNVADSLASIQKLAFDDKKYTLTDIVKILKNDFPDESIRQEFLNSTPKYGNDDDYVDSYAVRVTEHFCNIVKSKKSLSGMSYFAQPFTFLWLVEAGEKTAATPDGRRSGENLAYSISPMQGRDCKGLTALFNSIAKLPAYLAPGSTSTIIEIDPVLFKNENFPQLVIMLKTAIEKGVGQVQFNVVNADTLRKAQEEPDKYKNLEVRVSGFSQRFCLLDKKLQDHIIARTKHKKM